LPLAPDQAVPAWQSRAKLLERNFTLTMIGCGSQTPSPQKRDIASHMRKEEGADTGAGARTDTLAGSRLLCKAHYSSTGCLIR